MANTAKYTVMDYADAMIELYGIEEIITYALSVQGENMETIECLYYYLEGTDNLADLDEFLDEFLGETTY